MHQIARIIGRTFASTIVLLLLSSSACVEDEEYELQFRVVPGEDGAEEPEPDPGEEEGGDLPECPTEPDPGSSDPEPLAIRQPKSSKPDRAPKLVPTPECP